MNNNLLTTKCLFHIFSMLSCTCILQLLVFLKGTLSCTTQEETSNEGTHSHPDSDKEGDNLGEEYNRGELEDLPAGYDEDRRRKVCKK